MITTESKTSTLLNQSDEDGKICTECGSDLEDGICPECDSLENNLSEEDLDGLSENDDAESWIQ